MNNDDTVEYVRLFYGNADIIGLIPQESDGNNSKYAYILDDIRISAFYIMQYFNDGCHANCAFCVQARESENDLRKATLAKTRLIKYPYSLLLENLKKKILEKNEIDLICIQTVFNKNTFNNLLQLIKGIRSCTLIPITACCIPISRENMVQLKEIGLNRITINYETATPELHMKLRGKERNGPYRWNQVEKSLYDALTVFGEDNVGTHIQIGLGETQRELINLYSKLVKMGIRVSLFAFMPIPGTAMESSERASYKNYHKIQLSAYLLRKKLVSIEIMNFDENENIIGFGIDSEHLEKIILTGEPFRNFGCPGCNRVYYDNDASERFYSYPRKLKENEIKIIEKEVLESC